MMPLLKDHDDTDPMGQLRVALLHADEAREPPAVGCRRGSDEPGAPPSSPEIRSSSRAPMTAVERLMLSPYEKWRVHGRFPFKLALHVGLLLLTWAQMLAFEAQNAAYMRASHRNWAHFFLPAATDSAVGIQGRFERELYTVNETADALFAIRDAFWAIGDDSIANYEYPEPHRRPIAMTVAYADPARPTEHYLVTWDEPQRQRMGPFHRDLPAAVRRRLVRSLAFVRLSLALRDRQYGNWYDECFDWTIHVALEVDERVLVRARLDDCEVRTCTRRSLWAALGARLVWLHLVIGMVAAAYLVLTLRALGRSYRLISQASRTARAEAGDGNNSGRLPFSVRWRLFNGHQLLILAALILLVLSCGWSLTFLKAHVPISYWHRLLHATAILLLWSSLVGYLEHNRHIYSIVLTLRWGAPRVLQFLIGVSPIFVGFALFGTIYFGPRVKAFGSLSASMMTLFAVMNGDVILDTFDALERQHFAVAGTIYIYTFISLFIYVVLNIFIAIVEEAFFATRHCRRLLDILLTDPKFATTDAHQDAELSAEMMRLLLSSIEQTEDTEASGSNDSREV